jgi:UDP-N-acetylmuramoyl-tripeptide--D-alanyl-D-alanine ligase
MRPLTLQQLRQAVGGKPLSMLPADPTAVEAVCTDSRLMQKRSVFVALKGEHFDAHDHLAQAAVGGAVAALVERLPEGFASPGGAKLPDGLYVLQVPDTYAALGKLAKHVRLQMQASVVAVAGSNGKTGTKLLIDAALSTRLRGTCSPKSFNNNVGVPLTIFPADPGQDYLVLELGTNHHGEIAPLTEMAQPDVAVITNAGAEHLEGLDDVRGVRVENAAVTNGLNPKGMLVVNGDDADLVAACAGYRGKRVTFGFGEHNDLFAADVRCDAGGVRFLLNGRAEVFVPLLGRHTAANALAAVAVARRLGVPEEAIVEGLAHARGPDMRLQLTRAADVHVLNDAYNANPNSMRAALETIAALDVGERKVAVLGDMRELGRSSERYHRELGEQAATVGLTWLACVGEQCGTVTADAAVAAGMDPAAVYRFPDAAAAAAEVPGLVQPGDLVLVKASRGIRLEKVAQAIEASRHAAHAKAAV